MKKSIKDENKDNSDNENKDNSDNENKDNSELLDSMLQLVSNKDGKSHYRVGKTDSRKFYNENGVDSKTLSKIVQVNKTLLNGLTKITSDRLVSAEDGIDTVETDFVSDFGKYKIRCDSRERERFNPSTKEKFTSYGNISLSIKLKPLVDKDVLVDCIREIKESVE